MNSCALPSASLDIDIKNLTRSLTCGLDPNAANVIKPVEPVAAPPSSKARRKIPGLPPGVEVHVWEPCFRGRFLQVIRVQFLESPSNNYTCTGNALCVDGILKSRGTCFTTENLLLLHENGGRDSAGSLAVLLATAVITLLCLL